VRLLNFAYITLDKTRQLGSGSFSKVYLGSYRKERCAIKLIFTLDLTQDVIRRVAAEAQILSMIKHKNIVNILGVSVLPPSVCILLELCVFVSLADVIKAAGPLNGFLAAESNDRFSPGVVGGLTVCWADRLYLAMGCARGLHALHTFSSELCHRDIKSFNFLVDEHLNAKILDLEL
jgi:serine/threonine protein kinase